MTAVVDEMLVWLLRTLSDIEREAQDHLYSCRVEMLAGVEADRAVLEWATAHLDADRLEPVLRIVASRYRHRDGYVPGWAPGAVCRPVDIDNLGGWCGLPWGHTGRHFPAGYFSRS